MKAKVVRVFDSEAKFPLHSEVFIKNKILCYKGIFHIGLFHEADERGRLVGTLSIMDFCNGSCDSWIAEGGVKGEVLMQIPWKVAKDIRYMLDMK